MLLYIFRWSRNRSNNVIKVCVGWRGYARVRVLHSIWDYACTGPMRVPTLVILLNRSSRLVVLTKMNGNGKMTSRMR
jgi:hypothetical protein